MTIGSNSKQFTAFSIHLLAQDGKLSLDDDIRTYVPEVPDFGATITILTRAGRAPPVKLFSSNQTGEMNWNAPER